MAEPARVLVVDDDAEVVQLLLEVLSAPGPGKAAYRAVGETSPHAALARIERESFDVVVSDVEMPGMRGTELLAAIVERRPRLPVLVMTAFGSIELAVATVRAGACDFVTKPFKTETLVLAIERALRERAMRRELVRLRRDLGEAPESGLVSASPAMAGVLDIARRAARSAATVLVTGESGTGKGALARWIHDRSPRRDAALVQINCAALPAGLVEAELFGVKRGAFTDARESRDGLFVEASGGTLFLDEIAEMPLEAQAKLLQVLESGLVRPVGATAETAVDVRLIAATNRDLEAAIQQGKFREDLFFRLAVVPIEVPPLRARPEDIPELVHAFLARARRGGRTPEGITDEAMRHLCRRDWPGNVRELANVVERAVALGEHDSIVLEDVAAPSRARAGAAMSPSGALEEAADRGLSLAEVELAYIKQVVAKVGGNMAHAARVLRIDRRTLYRKLGDST